MLPLIQILEPKLATAIMNYLLLMNNTDLDNLVKKPSELVKKVCDLINKSQAGTYYLPAGGGGGRGAEGPHGQVDEGGDGFFVQNIVCTDQIKKSDELFETLQINCCKGDWLLLYGHRSRLKLVNHTLLCLKP